MTDQRVGRHVRIYEWDEVDIDDDMSETEKKEEVAFLAKDKKAAVPESPRRLSGLLKRKLF